MDVFPPSRDHLVKFLRFYKSLLTTPEDILDSRFTTYVDKKFQDRIAGQLALLEYETRMDKKPEEWAAYKPSEMLEYWIDHHQESLAAKSALSSLSLKIRLQSAPLVMASWWDIENPTLWQNYIYQLMEYYVRENEWPEDSPESECIKVIMTHFDPNKSFTEAQVNLARQSYKFKYKSVEMSIEVYKNIRSRIHPFLIEYITSHTSQDPPVDRLSSAC